MWRAEFHSCLFTIQSPYCSRSDPVQGTLDPVILRWQSSRWLLTDSVVLCWNGTPCLLPLSPNLSSSLLPWAHPTGCSLHQVVVPLSFARILHVASASFRQKDFPWPYCLARAVTGSLSLYHVSMFSTSFHVRWRMLSAVLGNVASSLSSHCPSCQDGRVATAGRRSWPRETAALCLLRVIQKRQTSIRDTEECRWGEKKKAEFTTTLPANICVEL